MKEQFNLEAEVERLATELEKSLPEEAVNILEDFSLSEGEVEVRLSEYACVIDVATIARVIELLTALPRAKKRAAAAEQYEMELDHWKEAIRAAEGDKNARAKVVRGAADALNLKRPKKSFNFDLLKEYLDLIGVRWRDDALIQDAVDRGCPHLNRKEAVQFLTEKHQIQSWDATYQQLKNARRAWRTCQAENKDVSFLEKILPGNWPPA
jgi:hypothetical protein